MSQALTLASSLPRLAVVEIPLTPDLQAKLSRLAVQQGRPTEALVVEAVERMVSHDEWFLREVQQGLAAADRGELIDHDEVRKLIDERYPG
jgi:predicted transcriptional regulator